MPEYMTLDLSGLWECRIPGQTCPVTLPGTLDENGVGEPDALRRPWHPDERVNDALTSPGPIATRLTRRHTHEGPALFRRVIDTPNFGDSRVFLEIERARHLTCRVNGAEVPHFGPHTLSSPHVFELTGLLTGRDTLELTSDNSYPGWPVESIVSSSAATDETQTNWNGLLGYIRLTSRPRSFLSSLRVYSAVGELDIRWDVSGPTDGDITLESSAIPAPVTVPAEKGRCRVPLRPNLPLWDEGEGNLHTLTASYSGFRQTVRFGVRALGVRDGHLTLNGRKIFLRSEANCAVFPETGHAPMDTESWRRIIKTYASYGVNLIRFHSHTPPEAAFEAADELGTLLQPELSNWDPKDAFASPESREYYRAELFSVLRALANHPSFVMLTLGNELHASDASHEYMSVLLREARAFDPTRLYAEGSNNHYGQRPLDPESGFYTSASYLGSPLRGTGANMTGWVNDPDAGLNVNYSEAVEKLHAHRPVPVISFEVGQFEVLPDFSELSDFRGVTDPSNLRLIRDRAENRGLLNRWSDYHAATGELALLCYRMETEAALRTPGLSGISLLGLQDFPGQGTALVGMLNSHLQPKPGAFSAPERFRSFFTGTLPLLELSKFTYFTTETLTAAVKFANYGRSDLSARPRYTVAGSEKNLTGSLPPVTARAGTLTDLGTLQIPLNPFPAPSKLTITINFADYVNQYNIWLYPDTACPVPENVHTCRRLDDTALSVLRSGGKVLLEPKSDPDHLTGAVKSQFSTDFWSVGTFPTQSGAMGLFVEKGHPAFDLFPTDSHSDLQWRRLSSCYALPLPEGARPLVTVMDSFAYMRSLSSLFECSCAGGSLLVSTFGLPELTRYPEALSLRRSLLTYASSPAFSPTTPVPPEAITHAICPPHRSVEGQG